MAGNDGSDVVFAAHMPLIRIDADTLPFAGGDLWRMPFEQFDALTMGAFADHEAKFREAAPVFYRLVVHPQLPNLAPGEDPAGKTQQIQIKMPGRNWALLAQLGFGFIERFHALAAEPAWLALLLEAPAALMPRPHWSVTFAVADEGWHFTAGETGSRVVSVQGDADLDYLLTPAFCTAPLPAELVERASRRAEELGAGELHQALHPALATLAQCSSPLLLPHEQATLATVGLEALLLPELRSGFGRALAHRMAALLAQDKPHASALESAARALYDARSASVHGGTLPAAADELSERQAGPRLLAAAILALQKRLGPTDDAAAVLQSLDDAAPRAAAAPLAPADADPRSPPQSLRARQPLVDVRVSMVAMVATNLEAPPGHYVMWAPLVGLRGTDSFAFADAPAPAVVPLTGHEVLLLEERDIARDFAARVRTLGEHIPALCIFLPEKDAEDAEAAMFLLGRQRDLAVASLRLAGFDDFEDPALTGSVVVRDAIRWRQPSVLRQSVWQRLLREDDEHPLSGADAARIAPHWRLLREYDRSPRHPDLEHTLALYRRSFDASYTSERERATMLFSVLECLLGRFRPRSDPVQLEGLVTRLLGSESPSARWFAGHGRAARNALAHGGELDDAAGEMLPSLCSVLAAAVPRSIRSWLDARETGHRPGSILVDMLAAD